MSVELITIGTAFLLLLLVGIAAAIERLGGRSRWLSAFVAALLFIMGGMNVAVLSVSGTPYTVHWLDLLDKQKGSMIISYVIVEHKAIYYWLQPEGAMEPFYLERPYSQEEAEKLRKAYERAREEGSGLYFDPSTDEFDFHEVPQPAPAPKNAPSEQPKFEHPGFDI